MCQGCPEPFNVHNFAASELHQFAADFQGDFTLVHSTKNAYLISRRLGELAGVRALLGDQGRLANRWWPDYGPHRVRRASERRGYGAGRPPGPATSPPSCSGGRGSRSGAVRRQPANGVEVQPSGTPRKRGSHALARRGAAAIASAWCFGEGVYGGGPARVGRISSQPPERLSDRLSGASPRDRLHLLARYLRRMAAVGP